MTSLSLYLTLEYKQTKLILRIAPKKKPEVKKTQQPLRNQQKASKKNVKIDQYEEPNESDEGVHYGDEMYSDNQSFNEEIEEINAKRKHDRDVN